MKINLETILSAGDMSTASLISDEINLDFKVLFAVQAVFTGAPVGTLKLQASLDSTTWTDISGSSTSVTAAGDAMWNLENVGYTRARCVYTKTSGTGALTVKANAKGV